MGITLIDTAASYGLSEERIGRHLGHRHDEFVLSTKGGQAIDGSPDWSPRSVPASIEQSLGRIRSEGIDVYLLHSCPLEVLQRGDLQDTLDQAIAAPPKLQRPAGDTPELGRRRVVETSYLSGVLSNSIQPEYVLWAGTSPRGSRTKPYQLG